MSGRMIDGWIDRITDGLNRCVKEEAARFDVDDDPSCFSKMNDYFNVMTTTTTMTMVAVKMIMMSMSSWP